MKKVSFALLILVLFSALTAKAEFSIGPKIGVNIDKFHFSGGNFDESNRCGFTGGLTAEFIVPVIGVGADISLMYTRMNTEVNDIKMHGNFLEIPLHLKYKFNIPVINSIIRPYVFTGPNVAFRFGSDKLDTKKSQWGWDLGLGVELIKHLQVGAGYTFGINKIAEIVYADLHTTEEIKVKNNYWTITAAWMF
ncbi:MAG: porin family protein [Candidatus Amulumruptor caecigallinarius]|nr:porin family protein [Candidatus Amulumruptor caecigallinarius]